MVRGEMERVPRLSHTIRSGFRGGVTSGRKDCFVDLWNGIDRTAWKFCEAAVEHGDVIEMVSGSKHLMRTNAKEAAELSQ